MIIDLKEVKKIILGAVSVTEDAGGFNFHRFTDEQEGTKSPPAFIY